MQAQGEGIREARLGNWSVVKRLGVEDRQDGLPLSQIKSGTDDPARPCLAIRPHEQVLFDQPVVTVREPLTVALRLNDSDAGFHSKSGVTDLPQAVVGSGWRLIHYGSIGLT